jgi:nitrile hydratase
MRWTTESRRDYKSPMPDVHDLGGRDGFGRVEREPREPVFHARWERRVMGLVYCAVGLGWINIDAFRHGIERMEPASYLRASYYERWLASLERGLREARVLAPGFRASPPAAGARFERTAGAPRFGVGDAVRVKPRPGAPPTDELRSAVRHSRLPGYASGKQGTIVCVRGGYVFPDTNAHGEGEQPQQLYTVRFAASELWGASAERASVCVDLFEPYLEAVAVEEARDAA